MNNKQYLRKAFSFHLKVPEILDKALRLIVIISMCTVAWYLYVQEEIVSLEPCTETADEVLVTDHEEETHNLSPPKALFLPSPNHPLHILVRHP